METSSKLLKLKEGVPFAKPRRGCASRVNQPRFRQQPVPHERDDEQLVRPVDIPDEEDNTDDEANGEEQPPQPPTDGSGRENPAGPRASGTPSITSQQRASRPYQVRQRDITTPIAPPADADQRDEEWSSTNWKKSVRELCDPNVEVVKRRLRRSCQ